MDTKSTFLLLVAILFLFNFQAFSQTEEIEYVKGEIFIKYKDDISTRAFIPAVYDRVNLEDVPQVSAVKEKYQVFNVSKPFYLSEDNIKLQNTYLVKFSDYQKIDELIAELEADPSIEYAEKIPVIEFEAFTSADMDKIKSVITAFTPNDPEYGKQWHLPHIKCPEAWDMTDGSGVVVAIIDGYVDHTHNDFNNWNNPGETPGNNKDDDGNGLVDDIVGWDFNGNDNNPAPSSSSGVTNIHGTHVAGCAVAAGNNNLQVASPGYKAELMSLAFGSNAGAAAKAISYAANNGADVINMSFGAGGSLGQTFQDIISDAWNKGVVVVATAGNGGDEDPRWPCSYNNVICVANTGNDDVKASSSQYNETVDMSSPGQNIYATYVGQKTSYMSGTSMAAPVLAGVVALMRSANPAITPDEVEACLKSTAVDIYKLSGNQSYIGKLGAGRVDALAAVECALSKGTGMPPSAGFSASSTSGCGSLSVQFTDESRLNPTSWLWDFGDGNTSTEQSPTHTYNAPGTYTVTLKVSNEHGQDQLVKQDLIKVGSGAPASAIKGAAPDTSMGGGGFNPAPRGLHFNTNEDIVIEKVTVYSDQSGNATINITNAAMQTIFSTSAAVNPGVNVVQLGAEVQAGTDNLIQCPGFSLYRNNSGVSFPYAVGNLVDITKSNATSNPVGFYYFFYDWEVRQAGCSNDPVGVNENQDNTVTVYPNPFDDVFNIELSGTYTKEVEIKFYNLIGDVVYEKNITTISGNTNYQVNLNDLPSGGYLIYIKTGNEVFRQKLMKE